VEDASPPQQSRQQEPRPGAQDLHAEVADVGDQRDEQRQHADHAGIEPLDPEYLPVRQQRHHQYRQHQQLQRRQQLASVEAPNERVDLGFQRQNQRDDSSEAGSQGPQAEPGQHTEQIGQQQGDFGGEADAAAPPGVRQVAGYGEQQHRDQPQQDQPVHRELAPAAQATEQAHERKGAHPGAMPLVGLADFLPASFQPDGEAHAHGDGQADQNVEVRALHGLCIPRSGLRCQ